MTARIVRPLLWFTLGLGAAAPPLPAQGEPPPIQVVLKDHRFAPAEIHVKAGQAAWLEVANQDGQPEEFESKPLNLEKVIAAGARGRIRLKPLKPGRYPFVGEYHEATAQGVIVAE